MALFGKKKKAEADEKVKAYENLDAFAPKSDEEIAAEVEDIAANLQSAIDTLMEENPDADWKELVNDAADKKRAWQSTRTICECCGQAVVYGDEIYCDDCKNNMKQYPFKWWHFIMPVVAIVVIAFVIWTSYSQWNLFSNTARAEGYVRDHQYSSALSQYSDLNDSISEAGGTFGWKYLSNQISLFEKVGIQEYSDMNDFLDTYYSTSDLKKFYNRNAKNAETHINEYSDIYTHFVTAANDSDGDVDSFLEAFDKEIEGEDVNAAYANYYRYYGALVYGADSDTQKKFVDAIAAEGEDYASLYLPLYAEIALNDADYATAVTYADQMLERNSEDTYAYTYKGVAYRMMGDTEAAAEELNKGLKVDSSDSPLNYQMAIITLLNEQYPLAEAYAETAYENAETSNNYISSASLYGLIAETRARQYKKAGNTDSYSSEHAIYTNIVGALEDYGYAMSDDVASVLNGKKTVEEIFTEGEGDFTW